MYEALRLSMHFVVRYFLLVLAVGAILGLVYGFVTSLIDRTFFVEVLIIDSLVGFGLALILGLFALYLKSRLPVRSIDTPAQEKTLQEWILPHFLIAGRTGSVSPLASLRFRRNMCLFCAGLAALTTGIQCIRSPNPVITLLGGVIVVGPLLFIGAYTMTRIDRLTHSDSDGPGIDQSFDNKFE
ncbi:MAG: hypothetical protein JNK90_25000 [Planctomycetaceae bacterium]|nr:hypothetical protein [Planctomycetaceae bacterium]